LLLLQVGVSVGINHFFLFVLELQLVIQEVLGVSQVLNGPLVLLCVLIFPGKFGIDDLLLSLGHDVLLLGLGEPLEVVWHESVWSQLRLGGGLVLGHDIRHVGSINLGLVLPLLIVSPLLLPVSLFLGKSLIVILKFFELLILAHSNIIFHHTPGSSDSLSLTGILGLFPSLIFCLPLVLSNLLLHPLLLEGSICLHSLAVVYKKQNKYARKKILTEIFSLELPATGDVFRNLFRC